MYIGQLLSRILSQLETISQKNAFPTISPEIITAILATLVAVITLVFNKYKERELQQRNIKIEKYTSFLSALISLRSGHNTSKELSETLQVLFLIGSKEVVTATVEFVCFFTDKTNVNMKISEINEEVPSPMDNSEDNKKKETQDALYSNLIQAMRNDLYGKKSTKKFPEKLSLTIFSGYPSNLVKELANAISQIKKN